MGVRWESRWRRMGRCWCRMTVRKSCIASRQTRVALRTNDRVWKFAVYGLKKRGGSRWLPPFFVVLCVYCVATTGLVLRLVQDQRELDRLEGGDCGVARWRRYAGGDGDCVRLGCSGWRRRDRGGRCDGGCAAAAGKRKRAGCKDSGDDDVCGARECERIGV